MTATSHVILVAFEVEADTMEEAQRILMDDVLPRELDSVLDDGTRAIWPDVLECWWVAMDERYDGNDNESAVFIPRSISQDEARAHLANQPFSPTNQEEGTMSDNRFDVTINVTAADGEMLFALAEEETNVWPCRATPLLQTIGALIRMNEPVPEGLGVVLQGKDPRDLYFYTGDEADTGLAWLRVGANGQAGLRYNTGEIRHLVPWPIRPLALPREEQP